MGCSRAGTWYRFPTLHGVPRRHAMAHVVPKQAIHNQMHPGWQAICLTAQICVNTGCSCILECLHFVCLLSTVAISSSLFTLWTAVFVDLLYGAYGVAGFVPVHPYLAPKNEILPLNGIWLLCGACVLYACSFFVTKQYHIPSKLFNEPWPALYNISHME